MPRNRWAGRGIAVGVLTFSAIFAAGAQAQDAPSEGNRIDAGAQLYDNWARLTFRGGAVSRHHPLWSGARDVPVAGTWRCVTCHGWDYRGAGGVGGDHGRVGGVPSLRPLAGRSVEEILPRFLDERHAVTADLPAEAARALALFLGQGQQETVVIFQRYLQREGQWQNGAWAYATVCGVCHGPDGRNLDLGTGLQPAAIGDIARARPWKFLHAVRFGHAGVMPSFAMMGDQAFVDLLAFAVTRLTPLR